VARRSSSGWRLRARPLTEKGEGGEPILGVSVPGLSPEMANGGQWRAPSLELAEKRRSESQSKRPYPRATPILVLLFLPAAGCPRRHDLDDVVVVCIFRCRFHAQYARGRRESCVGVRMTSRGACGRIAVRGEGREVLAAPMLHQVGGVCSRRRRPNIFFCRGQYGSSCRSVIFRGTQMVGPRVVCPFFTNGGCT
jgi:hypothetical protein